MCKSVGFVCVKERVSKCECVCLCVFACVVCCVFVCVWYVRLR